MERIPATPNSGVERIPRLKEGRRKRVSGLLPNCGLPARVGVVLWPERTQDRREGYGLVF